MKVSEILMENVYDDQMLDLLRRDCSTYLTEIGGIENALLRFPLFRGIPKFDFQDNEVIRKISVNQSRNPRDTALSLHTLADNWFEKHTGIRFRSQSIFVTGDYGLAHTYTGTSGRVAIVLPIGHYDYCWSGNYYDMTNEIDKYRIPIHIDDDSEMMNIIMADGDYYFNSKLKEAIASHHEIMVHCQSAYLVERIWAKQQVNRLTTNGDSE
jgi:hypothetical protein